MSKVPYEFADFVALPVTLKSQVLGKDVKHYIYVKAYEPKIPDEESSRALFLVNIPVTTTQTHLKQLFSEQMPAGHVQNVHFASNVQSTSSQSLIATTRTKPEPTVLGKRKRSQLSSTEYEAKLMDLSLPDIQPTRLHATGSTAIVIFLDRTSRDHALRACRKAAKSSSNLIWQDEPLLGVKRYQAQKELTFPPRADLLRCVDKYMTTYAAMEESRSRESAKKRAEPDEDGFVTVTRGSKGVVKQDEADEIKARLEEKKKKEKGLADFYRFQLREKRRDEQGQLVRQFENDRRKVNEMRSRRDVA